jgi:hypothetical protein
MLQSDADGELVLTGLTARFSMKDADNPRMLAGGSVELDDIDPDDTVAEWWAKVQAKVLAQDAVDDAAFAEAEAAKL